MKRILFVLLFFSLPLGVSAQLEIFLSTNNLPYQSDTWTSGSYPDTSASRIFVKKYFHREALTQEFSYSEIKLQNLIVDLYPEFTQAQVYDRYLSLKEISRQDFEKYIAFAIDPDANTLIADKASAFVLTPFESTFQNCPLNLTQRRAIVKDVVSRIYTKAVNDIDSIQYSNQVFGDCVIPFPDGRRGSTLIANSFPSNKIITQSRAGNSLRFGTLESEVKLFSLSQVTLSADFESIDKNNFLDLSSTRVEQDQNFPKTAGKNKILFLHQNHTMNPFEKSYLMGNTTIGYQLAGKSFSPSHPLFLRSTDSEEKRTISKWQKGENGIYMKTVVQENTYTQNKGIYIPNQTIDATTYYAIIYNYDTSAPVCEKTFFSHDTLADANFIFPKYPWFRSTKYSYFLCLDEESGCKCDSSLLNCFVRKNQNTKNISRVFTSPKALTHNSVLSNGITNRVGMNQSCVTGSGQKVYYDRSVPEISVTLTGYDTSLLEKEYVNNNGILYDGIQMPDASLSHIKVPLTFQADENLQMLFVLKDSYFSTKSGEGVSGLSSYEFRILEKKNNLWTTRVSSGSTFPLYNTGTNLKTQSHIYPINVLDTSGAREVFTKIGEYQAQIQVMDAAGNMTRLIYYFTILPAAIDKGRSTLAVQSGSTLYGNGIDAYQYTLTLKDRYENLISGKQIGSINQDCSSFPNCKFLRTDMTTFPPSGNTTLEIFNFTSSSDALGRVRFFARSKSPGAFTERFAVIFQNPAQTHTFFAGENSFLKPYQGILEVFHSGSWVSDILPVGIESQYRLKLQNLDGRSYSWSLNDFSSSLRGKHPLTSFSLSGSLVNTLEGKNFRGTFGSTLPPDESHKTLLSIGSSNLSQASIRYTLGGDTINYLISANTVEDTPVTLSDTRELQNPVKIIGNLQAVGNTQNLTERQNISDIDSSLVRSALRKNIEAHIKNRQHNTLVGGIKYIDKTSDSVKLYTLESDPEFETLIVRNGNIHILDDFNPSGKKVGIISYIDGGYNTLTGYQSVGNIYIEPEVLSIRAFIYSDGSLISSDTGIPVSGDLTQRTPLLQQQLSLVGALFSRNTLAGGREFSAGYILPGNQKTTSQNLARIYDLYYLRRGNENCTRDVYGFCDTPNYTILKYDTRIAESPPKLFSY